MRNVKPKARLECLMWKSDWEPKSGSEVMYRVRHRSSDEDDLESGWRCCNSYASSGFETGEVEAITRTPGSFEVEFDDGDNTDNVFPETELIKVPQSRFGIFPADRDKSVDKLRRQHEMRMYVLNQLNTMFGVDFESHEVRAAIQVAKDQRMHQVFKQYRKRRTITFREPITFKELELYVGKKQNKLETKEDIEKYKEEHRNAHVGDEDKYGWKKMEEINADRAKEIAEKIINGTKDDDDDDNDDDDALAEQLRFVRRILFRAEMGSVGKIKMNDTLWNLRRYIKANISMRCRIKISSEKLLKVDNCDEWIYDPIENLIQKWPRPGVEGEPQVELLTAPADHAPGSFKLGQFNPRSETFNDDKSAALFFQEEDGLMWPETRSGRFRTRKKSGKKVDESQLIFGTDEISEKWCNSNRSFPFTKCRIERKAQILPSKFLKMPKTFLEEYCIKMDSTRHIKRTKVENAEEIENASEGPASNEIRANPKKYPECCHIIEPSLQYLVRARVWLALKDENYEESICIGISRGDHGFSPASKQYGSFAYRPGDGTAFKNVGPTEDLIRAVDGGSQVIVLELKGVLSPVYYNLSFIFV